MAAAATTKSTFAPVPFTSSLSLDDGGGSKELWLLRFPKNFPLHKLPKKLKVDLSAAGTNGSGGGDGSSEPASQFTVKGRTFAASTAGAADQELGQMHVVVGEGDELEFGPALTRQVGWLVGWLVGAQYH